jgi:hypothetical protein
MGPLVGAPSVALRGIIPKQAHDLPALILCKLQEPVGARKHGVQNRFLASKQPLKIYRRVVCGSD